MQSSAGIQRELSPEEFAVELEMDATMFRKQ
jgi:hypothetical protein